MNPIPRDQLLSQLQWRYATKQFDPARKIPAADWEALETALLLSPSSFGLQPWKFILVDNPSVRESLVAASLGQRQVADASHLIVLAIKKNVGEPEINEFICRAVEVRGGSADKLAGYKDMMMGWLVKGPIKPVIDDWAGDQVYLALGNLLTSAAMLGIDACPMEGFDAAKYDEILGLAKLGLHARVLCPVGYRSSSDKYAQLPKVRFKKEDVFVTIN